MVVALVDLMEWLCAKPVGYFDTAEVTINEVISLKSAKYKRFFAAAFLKFTFIF